MNCEIKKRKNNRLKNYDYSYSNWYFVTICTHNKINFFGKIENEKLLPNKNGKIILQQWLWLQKQYEFVKLDEFVVMPNHIHGILIIDKQHHKPYSTDNPCSDNPRVVTTIHDRRHSLLSKTICAFKTTSSKIIHQNGCVQFAWQRSFYDHIIRNEKSLYEIRNYIKNNPLSWELDRNNIENNLL